MRRPSERYLIFYFLLTLIMAVVTLILYYRLVYRPIRRTTLKALRTADDLTLVLKSGCEIIIANSGSTNFLNVIGAAYPPGSVGVQKCRDILAR